MQSIPSGALPCGWDRWTTPDKDILCADGREPQEELSGHGPQPQRCPWLGTGMGNLDPCSAFQRVQSN